MNKQTGAVVAAVAAAALWLAGARAGEGPNKAAEGQGPAEREFVLGAARGGMSEVKLGLIAEGKAQTPAVKKFAARLVADYRAANKELATVVGKRLTIPEKMDRQAQQALDRVAELEGLTFDRAYLKFAAEEGARVVSLFEREAKDGRDADLKAFAARTLPTLRGHRKLAREATNKIPKEAPRPGAR
jgi:putative membrane protein